MTQVAMLPRIYQAVGPVGNSRGRPAPLGVFLQGLVICGDLYLSSLGMGQLIKLPDSLWTYRKYRDYRILALISTVIRQAKD